MHRDRPRPDRPRPRVGAPLSLLHGKIESRIERSLHGGPRAQRREYSLLDVLSRQHSGPGGHLQMKQVADAVVLSQTPPPGWSRGWRTAGY
ncbi:hypothetical protein SMICM304S_04862 [Streptomyces microflavus]